MPIVMEEAKCLYMSVSTYASISQSAALDFLQKTFDFLQPYTTDPELRFYPIWHPVGSRSRSRSLRRLKWEEVAQDFPLEGFDLVIWKEKLRSSLGRNPHVGGVCISFSQEPEKASLLEFALNVKEMLNGRVSEAVQAWVVELALSTFRAVEGVVGYITVDYVITSGYTMSPYERAVGLSYPWAARGLRSKVRGYYWGNLLSRGHVELLGGEEVLSAAPVYLVKKLENGYYLQLTEDINNIDRGKLAQLKEFLKPLLPEGYPQSPEYYQNLPDFVL